MKAVIYARYSAGPRQTDQSIEGQIRVCTAYCEQHGFSVIDTYCDRHISGRTDERPEFQRLIADARRKRFEAVVVYKTDRFARNKYDSAIYKRELKKNGIKIFYAAEAIPDGPEGIILESLMEGLAEYYSAELAQKIRRGMKESAYKCKSFGGGQTLGYIVDKDKNFQIDENEARLVQLIFEKYIKGEPNYAICEYLNAHGFLTKRGNQFDKNSINRIIKNRRYIGEYKYQDVLIKDGLPRIISDEVFNLAQREMERRRVHKKPKAPKAEYLLSGRLFCGHCKTMMQGVSGTSQTGNIYYYYYCKNNRGKTRTCNKKQIPRDKLEEMVIDLTVRYILRKDILAKLVERLLEVQEAQSHTNDDIAFYERKVTENKKAIANILKMIESGVTTQTLPARLKELEDEQAVLLGELSYLKTKPSDFTEDQILYMLMSYLEPFEGESYRDYQKRIITCFVSEVYVYDDDLKIFFNITDKDGHLKSTDLEKMETKKFDEGCVRSTKQ